MELTRRRKFIQSSPDRSSYETRPRRSRPTSCSSLQLRFHETILRGQISDRLNYQIGLIPLDEVSALFGDSKLPTR